MEKNPFNEFLTIIREEVQKAIKPQLITGIVKSSLPDIIIETNGIHLDKDNLEIDKSLLDRHNLINNNYENKLNVGDKVVLLRQGDLFLVLNKVVKL